LPIFLSLVYFFLGMADVICDRNNKKQLLLFTGCGPVSW
jgi:hypothetical protein